MLLDLIKQNRTYRKFHEAYFIDNENLSSFIELARLSPSPRNQQALKFILSNELITNNKIFNTLSWAGALPNWPGPEKGERPSAYIIILGDNTLITKGAKSYHEVASGIVAQSILIGAVEKKLGGCIIAAIKRKELRKILKIKEQYEILLVLALGKPKENIILEEITETGNYNYWRDKQNNHHVPKRSLSEIIIK